MPARNAAEYLAEALDSVRAQTFADWEVVAVDDGSRDRTYEILCEAGSRVLALHNETATGPAAARNRALEHASGELVVFLDADDLLAPLYLERQIEVFDAAQSAGRRVGLVCCDARLLDPGGYAEQTYLDLIPDRDHPLTLERVLRRNPIYITSLVPTEVGRAVGWFDAELFGTEDFGLWVKILERGYEAVLNPEPLATYRRHSGSISTDIARQGLNNQRVYALALARGYLNARQRWIAREAIRYNRAMEEVARLRFSPSPRSIARLLALLPLLAWVAVRNPRWWAQWLRVLSGASTLPPGHTVQGAHPTRSRSKRAQGGEIR